jgi:hypothetical protein
VRLNQGNGKRVFLSSAFALAAQLAATVMSRPYRNAGVICSAPVNFDTYNLFTTLNQIKDYRDLITINLVFETISCQASFSGWNSENKNPLPSASHDSSDTMNLVHAHLQLISVTPGSGPFTSFIFQARIPRVCPPWHQNHAKKKKQIAHK